MVKISDLPMMNPSATDKIIIETNDAKTGQTKIVAEDSSGGLLPSSTGSSNTVDPYFLYLDTSALNVYDNYSTSKPVYLCADGSLRNSLIEQMASNSENKNKIVLNLDPINIDLSKVESILGSGSVSYLSLLDLPEDIKVHINNFKDVQHIYNIDRFISHLTGSYDISSHILEGSKLRGEDIIPLFRDLLKLDCDKSYDLSGLFYMHNTSLPNDQWLKTLLSNALKVSDIWQTYTYDGYDIATWSGWQDIHFKNITDPNKAKNIWSDAGVHSSTTTFYYPSFPFDYTNNTMYVVFYNYKPLKPFTSYFSNATFADMDRGNSIFDGIYKRQQNGSYRDYSVHFTNVKFKGDFSYSFENSEGLSVSSWNSVDFSQVTKMDYMFYSISYNNDTSKSQSNAGYDSVQRFINSTKAPDLSSLVSCANMFDSSGSNQGFDFSGMEKWKDASWFQEKASSGALDHIFKGATTKSGTKLPTWATDAMKN